MREKETCGGCVHWVATNALKNYDGGLPGKCLATYPLWVDFKWGPRSIDTIMFSDQNAMACAAFTPKAADK